MCRSIGFRCIRPYNLDGKEPPYHAYVSSFPSPKFRAPGFPHYGFKLDLSHGDFADQSFGR